MSQLGSGKLIVTEGRIESESIAIVAYNTPIIFN